MNPDEPESIQSLLAILARRGTATSAQLQADLQRSQAQRVAPSGGCRAACAGTRRRPPAPATPCQPASWACPAQQPLWWVQADGQRLPWGRLSFLHGQRVHVQTTDIDVVTQGQLPWFLATLRAEGFIGRLLARELGSWGLATNPEALDAGANLVRSPSHTGCAGRHCPGRCEHSAIARSSTRRTIRRTVGGGCQHVAGGQLSRWRTGQVPGPGRQRASGAREVQPARVARPMANAGTTCCMQRTWPWPCWPNTACRWQVAAFCTPPGAATWCPAASTDTPALMGRAAAMSCRCTRCTMPSCRARASIGQPRADTLVAQARLPPQAAAQARALQQFGRLVGNSDMPLRQPQPACRRGRRGARAFQPGAALRHAADALAARPRQR